MTDAAGAAGDPLAALLVRAVALLRIDPAGLRGMVLRGRSGPVRDAAVAALAPLGLRRLHPAVDPARLTGGLDLAATLAAGRPVTDAGLLAAPGAFLLAGAERTPALLAGVLARALDEGRHCVVALDEGAEPDEAAPRALTSRLALQVTLPEGAHPPAGLPAAGEDAAASARLPSVRAPDEAQAALCRVAERLGVPGMDAPILALRAARANAALRGADAVEDEDLAAAAALVLVPRATRMPAPPAEEDEAPAPEDSPPEAGGDADGGTGGPLPDSVLEAAAAMLPPGLLAALAAGAARGAPRAGAGAARQGRRGRPLPSRPGRVSSDARVDLVATLRAAAPWQSIRRARPGEDRAVVVLPSDIHLARAEERAERLIVFAVDASGSAAAARLAEAKGAVERLLAEAYASRDKVALITFRGTGAELALPPTRSLVQAKRRLAGLPGGGGTPLAAGLAAAHALARQMAGRGLSPVIALLTDGRANVALDGRGDRAAAAEDASRLAALIRADRIPALVLDTGVRPSPALKALAAQMGARHLALPRAPGGAVSRAVAELA